MQFITDPIFLISSLALLLIFNITLLVLYLKLRTHYNGLTKGVTKKNLISVLEGIQKTLSTHERSIMTSKKSLQKANDDARLHLQKISLKRFNPFSNTGGDQSFILAILDGNKDGVMITSLHTRENTRFYVKSVKGGSGVEHPLSREEQKVIK